MRSTTARADIAAARPAVWAALTSAACTRQYLAGLSITSAWHADASVAASHGGTPVATGNVVVADEPSDLVYRLDEPVHQDVACWLAWRLEEAGPGVTRVTLTADTLPCDPPVDAAALLSSLKGYLERTGPRPGSAAGLLRPAGR